ncbi:nucleotidyl transferase AbiEii/AbiGii toxin family protein, partial [Candidatus Bipolaricaulota bacterium]
MKDRALQLVREATSERRKNVLREYLQAHILFSLQAGRAFEQLAFVGGTALRFLYGLRRYSEDLDFSLERSEAYDFPRLLGRIESDLTQAGFEVTMHPHEGTPVHSAFVRFPGLLAECGLSPHPTQKLSIKIEVDTSPPAGATLQTTVINRDFLLALQHHDLPSLMAGKLHAVLSRRYTKGRDIYDLLW